MHTVRITKPFYLGVYEVTQGEYQKVMGSNPSKFAASGDHKERVAGQDTSRRPVESVSWYDAVAFCNKLSQRDGLTPYYLIDGQAVTIAGGPGYRLPTEAEWEYACRAGNSGKYTFGNDASRLIDYAWSDDNSGHRTHPVGEKSANAFDLHDMHGNVSEWCWDFFDSTYYAGSPPDDPTGPLQAPSRVERGGGWYNTANIALSASRSRATPETRYDFLGFRVARVRSR